MFYGAIAADDATFDGVVTFNGSAIYYGSVNFNYNVLSFGDEDASIYYSEQSNCLFIDGGHLDFADSVISNAIWNGSTIGVAYGGTGKTSWTANAVVYASATDTLAQVTNVSGNNQKKFLSQSTNSSGTAQAPT